ncbi:MAG: hypothetical protein IJ272_05940 [Clostridia bacterium]|nr:hypothetical protein [Clostridia bacterium]
MGKRNEQVIVINDKLWVGIDIRKKRTIISLYENGVQKILSDMETGDYFWSRTTRNKHYIVAYSRGCMVNQIPLNIDAAYSITDGKQLDLSNQKLKVLLEYMFICRKGFELAQVLATINSDDLELVDDEEKEILIKYLTAGNVSITREQVIDYILKQYPKLKEYTNLTSPISVAKYKEIARSVREETLHFHVMPQDLHKLPNVFGDMNNPDATDYMQIYISEAKQNQDN